MKGSPIPLLATIPTLVLAAGHGGKDPGAESGKFNERDEVISIVDQIAALLRPYLGKAIVIAPHEQDTHETIPWLNKRYPHFASALAIEVHRDSSDNVQGEDADLRCGLYHGSGGDSRTIATMLGAELRSRGAHPRSWVRPHTESPHGSLGFIRQPACLSLIMELGFVEGRNDPQHLTRLARMAAGALLKTFAGVTLVPRGALLT